MEEKGRGGWRDGANNTSQVDGEGPSTDTSCHFPNTNFLSLNSLISSLATVPPPSFLLFWLSFPPPVFLSSPLPPAPLHQLPFLLFWCPSCSSLSPPPPSPVPYPPLFIIIIYLVNFSLSNIRSFIIIISLQTVFFCQAHNWKDFVFTISRLSSFLLIYFLKFCVAFKIVDVAFLILTFLSPEQVTSLL